LEFLFIIFLINQKMNNVFLKNYFGFNRQQRNGLFVLIVISFLLLIIRLVYPLLMSAGAVAVQNLALVEAMLDSNLESTQKNNKLNFYAKNEKVNLFMFDPNTVSQAQLIALGFSEKRASIFLKFRNRGFIFRKKEDLLKVFGISGNFYESLRPFIRIENKNITARIFVSKNEETKEIPKQKTTISAIELNSADSVSLKSLNGIGSVYAKRILKYRNILGGFTNVEQLREVYGFNDEVYNKIKSSVSVNSTLIKKVNLNKDDFKVVNKHPYLSYELTKTIFDFRRKNNINATNLKDLLGDNSLYGKLLPYLTFE